jgi:hypothetical protein
MGYLRLVTIENDRARMSVDDLAGVIRRWPALNNFIVLGDEIDFSVCERSTDEHMSMLCENHAVHGMPELAE